MCWNAIGYYKCKDLFFFNWKNVISVSSFDLKKKKNKNKKTQPNQQKTSLSNTWTEERAEWKENQPLGNKILYSENTDN